MKEICDLFQQKVRGKGFGKVIIHACSITALNDLLDYIGGQSNDRHIEPQFSTPETQVVFGFLQLCQFVFIWG